MYGSWLHMSSLSISGFGSKRATSDQLTLQKTVGDVISVSLHSLVIKLSMTEQS